MDYRWKIYSKEVVEPGKTFTFYFSQRLSVGEELVLYFDNLPSGEAIVTTVGADHSYVAQRTA